jgi:Arc/MetJ-type ribon-helix-helix transcriptional regulator
MLSELATMEGECIRKEFEKISDEQMSSKLFELLEFTVVHARNFKTQQIIKLNEQISSGIRELVLMGQWTNVSQILRALPENLKQAVAADSIRSDQIVEINNTFADQVAEFMDLSEEDRQSALNLIKYCKKGQV